MGEFSEYHLEEAMIAEIEEANEVASYLELSDDELIKVIQLPGFYCSRYQKLVKGIIASGPPFSKKQRWCLAKYKVKDYRK